MVSMKDIAGACNVSVATVSKALNGHNDIGEETKEYVKRMAKEMGYFPNSSARALKMNKSYNLGVLFVDASRSGLTHNYFACILESFKITAEKHGYDITFINGSKQRKDRMSYVDCCKHKGVDGVVIACIDFDDPEVTDLIQSNIPVVTIDYVFNNRVGIMSDNIKGMKDLFQYIYDCGHRKIAYIHGESDLTVTKNRLVSFYKTADSLGVHIPDEYIAEAPYRNIELTSKATNDLLNLSDPPTCILFQDDFASIGGINLIKSRGLSIPNDISVAGYDGIQIAKIIDPVLTTVNQATDRMGEIAAEKLISLIEKPKLTLIEQIVIPGELETGASVKILL